MGHYKFILIKKLQDHSRLIEALNEMLNPTRIGGLECTLSGTLISPVGEPVTQRLTWFAALISHPSTTVTHTPNHHHD